MNINAVEEVESLAVGAEGKFIISGPPTRLTTSATLKV